MVKVNISKNGITNDIKKLLKAFRRNRKLFTPLNNTNLQLYNGGGSWFELPALPFFNKKPETNENSKLDATYINKELGANDSKQNQNNLIAAKNINIAIGVAKGAAGALVAAELLSHAAEPLLAASGVGIPLLAVIIVAKKLAKQYKQNLQLNAVLSDVIIVLQNCILLEALIKKTMDAFVGPVQDALKKEKQDLTTQGNYSSIIGGGDEENNVNRRPNTNNVIEDRIKEKLKELNILLNKISPQDNESRMSSISKKFKRFFFSEQLKNEIVTNLTVINGLFAIYNSQFDWSIRYYERKILDNLDSEDVLKNIWNDIEKSDEYTNYLFQNSGEVDEIIKDVKQDPNIIKEIKDNITDAANTANTAENPINNNLVNLENNNTVKPENTIQGGNKSYKRKNKNKNMRKTHKNKNQ